MAAPPPLTDVDLDYDEGVRGGEDLRYDRPTAPSHAKRDPG